MAKNLTPIDVKLKLDASGVSSGAKAATASVGDMTKALLNTKIVTGTVSAVASATGAAIKGVVSVVKQSVSAYADYEQQVGGIEALFGANGDTLEEYAARVGKSTADATAEYAQLMEAQDTVMQNANDAWINQGMSANEYMQQVTGFAAALKQSTADSTEAANVANMAMSDMADNANKFGTDIGSIQNAYQGFAKQNYTMLDNLKLGYGGTKEEMQRLLTEAEKVTGIHYDINQLDDVYNAIHVIQGELNITGTTASEAMGTISGSASALSAAWQNTLIALGSGEGIDTAIQNLVTAFSTFADNILPVIQTVLESAGTAIAELAPKVAEMLPGLVEAVLPNILSALTSLVTSIATMLGDQSIIDSIVQAGVTLFSALLDNLPAILTALGTGIINLIAGIGKAIGEQFPAVKQAFTDLFGDIDLAETGKEIINKLKKGISDAWEGVKKWLKNLDIGGFIKDTFKGVGDFFSGLFGGGGEETETEVTNTVTATTETTPADSTVTMPTGVMTVDTAALNPVSEEVIASWQALADAIKAVNAAIMGGSAGAGEAAEGAGGAEGESSGAGLLGNFTELKDVMTEIRDLASELATAFGTTLVDAVKPLTDAFGFVSTDENGAEEATEGTLAASLKSIRDMLKGIRDYTKKIADLWKHGFQDAADMFIAKGSEVEGIVTSLSEEAEKAATNFNNMADAIWAVVDAYNAFEGATGFNNSGSGDGSGGVQFCASGGPVTAGSPYIIGEEGPELFVPNRSGYIVPNDELASGGSDTVINVVFSGDVIGDEKSISSYVKRAVKAGIRQEVLIG